jgi:DNA (cytosine-5)-methyltransferase 1
MPDKDNLGAVLQPIGYRWQNNRDGLQQDDAVAAMRASTGSSGFHEMNHPVVVAHAFYSTGGTHGVNQHPEVSPAVKVGSGLGIPSPPAVAQAMTVRRLTPRECERLQGFPDDYTLIPWRKKSAEDCPDGPRYKALGNSMACHCMAWIGERIAKWEAGNK